VRISESDMYLFPDLDTFALVPWRADLHKTARLICNVYTPDGEQFIGAPRTALIRVLEEAREMGFDFRTGPELEFFFDRHHRARHPGTRRYPRPGRLL
jgi:glutamine synthetase